MDAGSGRSKQGRVTGCLNIEAVDERGGATHIGNGWPRQVHVRGIGRDDRHNHASRRLTRLDLWLQKKRREYAILPLLIGGFAAGANGPLFHRLELLPSRQSSIRVPRHRRCMRGDINTYEVDGHPWVSFYVHPLQRDDVSVVLCSAPLRDRRWVTNSGGYARAALRHLDESQSRR